MTSQPTGIARFGGIVSTGSLLVLVLHKHIPEIFGFATWLRAVVGGTYRVAQVSHQ
ncbi:MAG: hypothetical protein JNN08_11990 [Bryobacterales bacterium]|nr:hypothetical protein [Bryobacterales bacterium]